MVWYSMVWILLYATPLYWRVALSPHLLIQLRVSIILQDSLFLLQVLPLPPRLLVQRGVEGAGELLLIAELVEPQGPGGLGAAYGPHLALGVVGVEVAGGPVPHLGVHRTQVPLLGLVGEEDVLAEAVGVVLLHPVRARHVEPLAVAAKLGPVLLIVAVDKDGVV